MKPLVAVKFGDCDRPRVGDWVIAIGNPFGLGGTVTAGIISRASREHRRGPLRQLHPDRRRHQPRQFRRPAIQPRRRSDRRQHADHLADRRFDRHRLRRALQDAWPAWSISFAQFGELRRGWLGVRIQQVTDEIAESLNIKPARGALIAGVDDKGPAKPAGIEPGDVVVKFDGKDIKEPKDLSRVVADTAVGKEVDVVIIRKGEEQTKKVTLGRLEDNDKPAPASTKTPGARREAGDAEGARPRSRDAEQGPAQPLQDQGQRQGRRHHQCRRTLPTPPRSGSAPAR